MKQSSAATHAALIHQVKELTAELQQCQLAEARLHVALDAGRMGVWDWNVRTNVIHWSDNLAPIHGLAPENFGGTMEAFQELIHPEDRELVGKAMERSLRDRSSYDVEYRTLWPDGTVRWMAGKGKVICDQQGEPLRMVGVGLDVTERRRAELDARFLADVSAALASVVDQESTLQRIASLAVPSFADWCAVDILEDDGTLRHVTVVHVDPVKIALAHQLQRRLQLERIKESGIWNILSTGRAELVAKITDEHLQNAIHDSELLHIIRKLAPRSWIGVPLSARGKVFGVVSFLAAESGRRYDASDLRVAEELAHRAGMALDNARLYEALRAADRRKDEFLALLGHELRNPLAPIRNALQIFRIPDADAEARETARGIMERQVEQIIRLVDDLLDIARIMRGKIELRRAPLDLETVVARAIETVRPLLDADQHTLTVSVDPGLRVHADAVRLSQVLGNLLTNAGRYTPHGGRITLTTGRDGDQVVMRIRDNGIGISADMLPRLFDMFFQAERRGGNSRGGMGIGLALVRGLVELHGGTVTANSAGPGHGSEFVVRLPLLCEESEALVPATNPESPASEPPRRVLVVDDNADAAESLALLLRLRGHEVSVAHDGAEAVALADVLRPDLAFLDLVMPEMDGLELARRLRAHPGLDSLTLIALTGWSQPEDQVRSLQAGFDLHVVKPLEPQALRHLLQVRRC